MNRDDFLAIALVLTFATLVTSHVAIIAGLFGVRPRKRAVLAFFVAPLAPYWGFRAGMRFRAVLWVTTAIAYAVLRVVATLG